jgi:hypothetical protein
MAKDTVTRVVPDDTIGFYLGLGLFAAVVPILFVLAWWLSPRGEGAGSPARHVPEAAEAAPAAEGT